MEITEIEKGLRKEKEEKEGLVGRLMEMEGKGQQEK